MDARTRDVGWNTVANKCYKVGVIEDGQVGRELSAEGEPKAENRSFPF